MNLLETKVKKLSRDLNNSALINTDAAALNEYKIRKKMNSDINMLKNHINNLNEEIEKIKEILSNKEFK